MQARQFASTWRRARILRLAGVLNLAALILASPAAAQADAGQETAPALELAEIGVGTGWDAETRSLVGEAETFAAGTDQLYCRTLITGAQEPTTVTHVWYREGKTMARVELAVDSAHWRTKSSKRLLPEWTGGWEVKVLDAAGTVLGSTSFTIE